MVIALPSIMNHATIARVHLASMGNIASIHQGFVRSVLVGITVVLLFFPFCHEWLQYITALGTCQKATNNPFPCVCAPGWEGERCQRRTNYCYNITCQNRGVCRSLLLNYSCECVYGYYGQYCETATMALVIHQIVSTSFAYVAIIAMGAVAMFVVVMDILKYCFGIDPVEEERKKIQQTRRAKKHKPVIQRFVYVNTPTASSSEPPNSTTAETRV